MSLRVSERPHVVGGVCIYIILDSTLFRIVFGETTEHAFHTEEARRTTDALVLYILYMDIHAAVLYVFSLGPGMTTYRLPARNATAGHLKRHIYVSETCQERRARLRTTEHANFHKRRSTQRIKGK